MTKYMVIINGDNAAVCDDWSQVLDEIALRLEAMGTVDRLEIVVETEPEESEA